MRQKLDFSLLVLTSFLVVLALEPGAKLSSSQATIGRSAISVLERYADATADSRLSLFGPALPASWLSDATLSSLENSQYSPTRTVLGATEERLLRLWELKQNSSITEKRGTRTAKS